MTRLFSARVMNLYWIGGLLMLWGVTFLYQAMA
jgi:hypothetical protein